MNRILITIVVLITTVSCLKSGTYSESYPVYADFEYSGNYNTMFNSDSLYVDTKTYTGFGWNYLAFYQKVNKTTSEFEGGFLLSYLSYPASGLTEGLKNNKYRVYLKTPPQVRNTYLVYEQTETMPESDMAFSFISNETSKGTCVMRSCMVNNSVEVAEVVKSQFEVNDKIILKATGYLAGKETGFAEILLAEKTSVKDSIMNKWTIFDLSKLGEIDKVDFDLLVPEGKNFPKTVCIDDVFAEISLSF